MKREGMAPMLGKIIYLFGACVYCISMVSGAYFDGKFGLYCVFEITFQTVFLAAVVIAVRERNIRYRPESYVSPSYLIIAVIQLAVNIVVNYGKIDTYLPVSTSLCILFAVFLISCIEELYFRTLGCNVFADKDGRLTLREITILSVCSGVCFASYSLYLRGISYLFVLYLVLGVASGFFRVALYMRTGSTLLCAFVLYLFNLPDVMFSIYSHTPRSNGFLLTAGMLMVNSIISSVSGLVIYNKTLKKGT